MGRVGRPHGLEGAFVVEDASDDPDRFEPGATLLVDGEQAEVVERKRAGNRLVVRLDRPVVRGTALRISRGELPEPEQLILADAQTSGGLLIAVDDGRTLVSALGDMGVPSAVIGRVSAGEPGRIALRGRVRP